jgi:nucleotide-binding universal stress UspA family protein
MLAKEQEAPMSYKSIVAVASGETDDASLLAAAAMVATRSSGQVRVIPGYPDPAANLVYFGAVLGRAPDTTMERVRAGEAASQQQLRVAAREAAEREGIRFQACGVGPCLYVEDRALLPAIAIAEAAVLADLVMFAGRAARDLYGLAAPFAETLLEARAPVLLIKGEQFGFRTVAIAWDGSAQAGRAVRAAMPLLQFAQEVVILQNADDLSEQTRASASPEALIAHLARHGVAQVRSVAVGGDNVANALLRAAHEQRCALLVAGAYGRPRLYELALGGTTRALVNADDRLHLLLAH